MCLVVPGLGRLPACWALYTSPRSSGERATASGAVSAGSNPAGGTKTEPAGGSMRDSLKLRGFVQYDGRLHFVIIDGRIAGVWTTRWHARRDLRRKLRALKWQDQVSKKSE